MRKITATLLLVLGAIALTGCSTPSAKAIPVESPSEEMEDTVCTENQDAIDRYLSTVSLTQDYLKGLALLAIRVQDQLEIGHGRKALIESFLDTDLAGCLPADVLYGLISSE